MHAGTDTTGPAADGGGDTTVLMVDDETGILDAYANAVRLEYEVLTATSGTEALEKIDECVDVVFLDQRMPGMDGDETLKAFRERGYDVPVVMLTAVDPGENIVELPFDEYLMKPVNVDQLLDRVETLTGQEQIEKKRREFYQLASKKKALETNGISDQQTETYEAIGNRMLELRNELNIDEKL